MGRPSCSAWERSACSCATSEAAAKADIEQRFRNFLDAAKLQPRPEASA